MQRRWPRIIMLFCCAIPAVLVGTRWAAAALGLLCLGTAFGVHLPVGDVGNMMHFYKNLALAGGFLYVMNYGAGGLSIDEMLR